MCCHAAQHKVFVTAPDVPLGFWEFYAVTDDDPAKPGGCADLGVRADAAPPGTRREVSCCA